MAPADSRMSGQIPEEKLGQAEVFFQRVHDAFSGGSAILCVSARIAGPLDVQLVKQSCRKLWERHPLLRARISVRTDGPYFTFDVPFNRIPIHSVFELGKTDIRTFVEREISSAFDTTRCLWKVLLVTDKVKLDKHYLVVCTHRSISDPFCTVSLAREMLEVCAQILSGMECEVSLLPVSPNFEQVAASIPESLFSEGTPDRKKGEAAAARVPCPDIPINKRNTRIRSHTIKPERLKQLKALGRSEKATMRGTLAAVTVMAMQKQLGENVSIEIHTPLSIRKLTMPRIGKEEMRCLAYDARIQSKHIADSASFWSFARDYEAALLASAPSRDWPARALEMIDSPDQGPGLPLSCSLLYANEIRRIQKSPFTIENFLLVRGLRSADKLVFISAMPVQGSLPVTFAYASPLLDDAWADKFVKNFIHILEKTIK
jgi:hypothetical protein